MEADSGSQKKSAAEEYLTTEVYPKAMEDGHVSIELLEQYAKALQDADIESMSKYLEQMGYTTNITASVKRESKAQIIRIQGGSAVQNISQVQFSPGGGRHGPNPYLKFSTADQGIIKIVFGDPATYKTDNQEKATVIFANKEG